jgi:hypothetical protein
LKYTAGHRPPVVDVERAAVKQRDVEIVVAAERVVPREPVDENDILLVQERPELREALLVRAQHAVRVDHALRFAGRPRREQDLRNRVRTDSRVRRSDGVAVFTRAEIRQRSRVARRSAAAFGDERHAGFDRFERSSVRIRVGGEDQRRTQRAQDELQTPQISVLR